MQYKSCIFFSNAAINITVESEGILSASNGGFLPGGGVGAGIGNVKGSSGGSHGGMGGHGTGTNSSGWAHDSTLKPTAYGSGGGSDGTGTVGRGGGVLELKASGFVEVDGTISADGEAATEKGIGGGAGGSIYVEAGHFAGMKL
ncbi:hypothetical protein DPMN_117929 [Dreissena polymorpha]|uniref:Uncharacterized protein n=1 Tax=Dreissena polymorpha TaxID=45954 RepID=A0A9D4GGL4_DREPO|nr:hypothetical protein DPMN_117929 [Dreissena polymorpha]